MTFLKRDRAIAEVHMLEDNARARADNLRADGWLISVYRRTIKAGCARSVVWCLVCTGMRSKRRG